MTALILVIEDDRTIRSGIAETLELEGFRVMEAENGAAGLGILQLQHPDLILCDINMPDFDGFQILRHVRKNEALARTPFLFITAVNDRRSMRQGMDLGADDYLTKPFSNIELVSAVKSRLERHKTLVAHDSGELEKAKKQLVHMVSHELRTPLVSVVMIEQLINRQIDALSKDQIQDLLGSWKSGAHRLHHLVEQMVLMTQIDSGLLTEGDIANRGEIKNVWLLVEAAVGIARQFAYRHPHGKVELETATEALNVKCNSQALQHAFGEIVSNALDFSPEGTTVGIEQIRHGPNVRIVVTDSGPGLTTRRLERALMPFEQIDREKQEQQGMGLGLPLAKKIIELHGGAILFRKIASGGTQVVIQLPLHSR